MPGQPNDIVEIDYENWRGERALRRIRPIQPWYGLSIYHKGKQWFWSALDLDKMEQRDFAMEGIRGWRVVLEDDDKGTLTLSSIGEQLGLDLPAPSPA